MVAWGGIEPPTQGFSIQRTVRFWVLVSRRNVTSFPVSVVLLVPSTEPVAKLYRALGLNGHRFSEWNQRNSDTERRTEGAEPMMKRRVTRPVPSAQCPVPSARGLSVYDDFR